jgi:quercetin dioxygenase-like cupin family protein
LLKITRLEEAISTAKRLAEDKLAAGENADEFVEIGEIDGAKLYVAAGKTIKVQISERLHENRRDVFMYLLEGEIEFTFENGKKQIVEAGECFVLPKRVKHLCISRKMTIAIEGVYEKGF